MRRKGLYYHRMRTYIPSFCVSIPTAPRILLPAPSQPITYRDLMTIRSSLGSTIVELTPSLVSSSASNLWPQCTYTFGSCSTADFKTRSYTIPESLNGNSRGTEPSFNLFSSFSLCFEERPSFSSHQILSLSFQKIGQCFTYNLGHVVAITA